MSKSLVDRIDYVINDEKTEQGSLISTFQCDVKNAELQFSMSKNNYKLLTGRSQKNDVLAYQVRQSFSPEDNITPEIANQIGYELAEKLTHGNHAFIVATHTDKSHIHNHIVINSTSLDCRKKFRNFWNSYKAVQQISDVLCLKNGLSIVEQPKEKGIDHGSYSNRPPNFSDKLRTSIDECMAESPKDFDDFLKKMTDRGYIVKRGKHIAFHGNGQKKFIRLRSLGETYSEENLRKVLSGEQEHIPKKKKTKEEKVNLLIDLQSEMNNQKGEGYKRWAKKYNTRQMAKTMMYLSEHKLQDYNVLCKKCDEVNEKYDSLSTRMTSTQKELTEIALMRKMIIQYARTKDTMKAYQKTGYNQNFKEQNFADISKFEEAKNFFKEAGIESLPKMADLNSRYAELKEEKSKLYSAQKEINEDRKELLNAKGNIETILNKKPKEKEVVTKKKEEQTREDER